MKYFIILFTVAIVACKKDFLEPKDTSTFNRQTYINNLSSMEQFANGIQLMLDRDFQRGVAVVYGDLVADNVKPADPINPAFALHYAWSQKPSENIEDWISTESTAMNGEWKSGYLSIRACNFVIEDVDKYREENIVKADKLKGQAYAIRAMVHLKLVNIFAQNYTFSSDAKHTGIPYITTSDITAAFTRSNVAEVYDNIIKDLTEAVRLMPPGIINSTLMNQPAAKALLARAYLYKGDYENAKKIALEVAAEYPLMTVAEGYPDKLYYHAGSASTEILYQLTPASIFSPVLHLTDFAGSAYRGFGTTFRPTMNIVNIIQENSNDIRNNWFLADGANYTVVKYPIGVAGIHFNAASDYYHTVLRSSEMFLTVAEAAFQTNDEITAREYLNAIRKRADPSLPEVTAMGEALKDSIYKERRKELAFEGMRMYDLQRWQIGVQRTDVMQGSLSISLPYPSNKAIAPIPTRDVRLGGISQNKDY